MLQPGSVTPRPFSSGVRYELTQGLLVQRVAGDPVWLRPDETLRVTSAFEKEGWAPRQEDRREGFAHPGTCVSIQGKCWEVRAILRDEEGSGFSYTLTAWDPAFPIRQVLVHDEAHHQAELARRRKELREGVLVYPALYAAYPLLGLLPSHHQQRLRDDYGLDAIRMTVISAFATFALGAYLVASALNRLPEPLGLSFLLGVLLCADGLVRFRVAWGQEQPIGSMFVALPVLVWEAVMDAVRHEKRRLRGDPRVMSARRQAQLVARLDTVQPTAGGGIVVQSYFPKDWSDDVTIGLEGRFFVLEKRSEEPSPDGVVFVYHLRKAAVDEVLRSVTPYRPDEGLRELEARERETKADRLNMIGPILGLLPAAVQARWEPLGYMPLSAVRTSCLIFGLGATLQLWQSLARPAAVPAGVVVETVCGAYLLLESAYRFYRVLYGQVTGSLLGLPLGLLLQKLSSGAGAAPPSDEGTS